MTMTSRVGEMYMLYDSGKMKTIWSSIIANIFVFLFNSVQATVPNLTPVAGSPFAAQSLPRGIQYSPNGQFLAVTNGNQITPNPSSIGMYQVNQTTGDLTLINNFPTSINGPFNLVFYHNGSFIAVSHADNPATGNVTTYSVDNNGILTAAQTIATGGLFETGIALSPDQRFIAVANRISDNSTVFSIDMAGLLTPVGIFATARRPFGISYSPSGSYLAITNPTFDNSVTVYSVNAITGALTPIHGTVSASSFATQFFPRGVAFSPTSAFAAVANTDSNTVSVYSVNQATGDFSPITGNLATSSFSVGSRPSAVAYSPDGSILVVANEQFDIPGNSTITVFSVDPATGFLSSATDYPVQVKPNNVAFSPCGDFLAVTNNGSNSISVFATNLPPIMLDAVTAQTDCNPVIITPSLPQGSKMVSVTTPAHGVATFTDISIIYTPNKDFSGTDIFSITVRLITGCLLNAQVTVMVNCPAPPIPPVPPVPSNQSELVRAIRNKYCKLIINASEPVLAMLTKFAGM